MESYFQANQLLVLAAEGAKLAVIVCPSEFQRPAPFSQAGEDQAVPLQVNLWEARLRFKIRCNII
jgi:hypothetical protein